MHLPSYFNVLQSFLQLCISSAVCLKSDRSSSLTDKPWNDSGAVWRPFHITAHRSSGLPGCTQQGRWRESPQPIVPWLEWLLLPLSKTIPGFADLSGMVLDLHFVKRSVKNGQNLGVIVWVTEHDGEGKPGYLLQIKEVTES